MKNRVVVLGCGVGGTAVAHRLVSSRPGLHVTVVDSHGDHVQQPLSIGVALAGRKPGSLRRDARTYLDPRVELVVGKVSRVDQRAARVELEDSRQLPYDGLAIATGSRSVRNGADPIPGLSEGTSHFHCPRSAALLHQQLLAFQGGHVVVGAARLPCKCPPSPIEFVLGLHEFLVRRGLRDRSRLTYVYPLATLQPQAALDDWARPLLEERSIETMLAFEIREVDPAARRLVARDGRELPYDLAVLVPPHAGPEFAAASGLPVEDGWIAVDARTLAVADRVYALGDAARIPGPKCGSAARIQAEVVAENLLAELAGEAPPARHDGRAILLVETGRARASRIDYHYDHPPRATRPTRANHWARWLVERTYYPLLARSGKNRGGPHR